MKKNVIIIDMNNFGTTRAQTADLIGKPVYGQAPYHSSEGVVDGPRRRDAGQKSVVSDEGFAETFVDGDEGNRHHRIEEIRQPVDPEEGFAEEGGGLDIVWSEGGGSKNNNPLWLRWTN